MSCLVGFQDPSNASFKDRMKEFMQTFDENGDGKIEMSEVNFTHFHCWTTATAMV